LLLLLVVLCGQSCWNKLPKSRVREQPKILHFHPSAAALEAKNHQLLIRFELGSARAFSNSGALASAIFHCVRGIKHDRTVELLTTHRTNQASNAKPSARQI
jgi:hypothetical protein